MASYDPASRTITIRIVYDGLGTAGKTTNIKKIHELFTLARLGEVYIPEEHKGRTLYFDWLDLETGFLEDYRLRCQLITVPGQFAYVQRRWQLLCSPDAIVAVIDSTPAGIKRADYAMRFLRATLRSHLPGSIPIIVQANKQDLPGALPAAEVARELNLEPSLRIVEASAMLGDGVRSTLVFAIQAARERAREVLLREGIEAFSRKTESAEDIYQQMLIDSSGEGEILADELLTEGASPFTPLVPLVSSPPPGVEPTGPSSESLAEPWADEPPADDSSS